MQFESYLLPAPLCDYIESMFHFRDYRPDHSIERVVPTGHIYLIFALDGMSRNIFDNRTMKPVGTLKKVWISGMHNNHLTISAHEQSEMLVVQFKPYGAFPFLRFPVNRLNNQVRPADRAIGKEMIELHESLMAKETTANKFVVVENWLKARYRSRDNPPQVFIDFVSSLQFQPVSSYQELQKEYPYTPKHLIAQFKRYVGLTPKYYHRILRFNELLQQIHKQEKITWAQIAYQCGFSDQSHFIKEFKHFSGFNPKQFIQEDFHKEEPNFFPLNRKG